MFRRGLGQRRVIGLLICWRRADASLTGEIVERKHCVRNTGVWTPFECSSSLIRGQFVSDCVYLHQDNR